MLSQLCEQSSTHNYTAENWLAVINFNVYIFICWQPGDCPSSVVTAAFLSQARSTIKQHLNARLVATGPKSTRPNQKQPDSLSGHAIIDISMEPHRPLNLQSRLLQNSCGRPLMVMYFYFDCVHSCSGKR